jgi:hypothetical protein
MCAVLATPSHSDNNHAVKNTFLNPRRVFHTSHYYFSLQKPFLSNRKPGDAKHKTIGRLTAAQEASARVSGQRKL